MATQTKVSLHCHLFIICCVYMHGVRYVVIVDQCIFVICVFVETI